MFKIIVLLDRRGVCQMHRVARLLQTINQPVPIERRFHDHAKQLGAIRTERG